MASRKGHKPPGRPNGTVQLTRGMKFKPKGPAQVSPRKQMAGMPVSGGGKKKRIPSIQK